MNSRETVGQRLRKERTRLGFNIRDFAERAGVGKSTQSNYENYLSLPDSEYLNRISALGAEIFWIMRGSEEDDEVRDKRAALYPPEVREFIENYMLCPETVQASLRTIAADAADKKRRAVATRQADETKPEKPLTAELGVTTAKVNRAKTKRP